MRGSLGEDLTSRIRELFVDLRSGRVDPDEFCLSVSLLGHQDTQDHFLEVQPLCGEETDLELALALSLQEAILSEPADLPSPDPSCQGLSFTAIVGGGHLRMREQ
ncbi:hypothetical protein AOXY_G18270 [Acipenser oxyrinchus oxyrinchus]|uniref:Uncharacterized protein n=1 Tax=Acipenser oxyrinchus oxyrinchus TaxID=40147 RepID=A0AAD8FYI5_ACIOX|nr:hypothetical protein AOXY_G18270 [Acipenser oxyrinchus oxyrinchus]